MRIGYIQARTAGIHPTPNKHAPHLDTRSERGSDLLRAKIPFGRYPSMSQEIESVRARRTGAAQLRTFGGVVRGETRDTGSLGIRADELTDELSPGDDP